MGVKSFHYKRLYDLLCIIFKMTNIQPKFELFVAADRDEGIEIYPQIDFSLFESYHKPGTPTGLYEWKYYDSYVQLKTCFYEPPIKRKQGPTKKVYVIVKIELEVLRLHVDFFNSYLGNTPAFLSPTPLILSAISKLFSLCNQHYMNASPHLALHNAGDDLTNYCLPSTATSCEEIVEDDTYEYAMDQNDAIQIDFQIISHMAYEKASNNGALVILPYLKTQYHDPLLDIEFEQPVSIKNHKLMRKLLEIAKGSKCLVGNKLFVFGIAEEKKLIDMYQHEESRPDKPRLAKVIFKGATWEIKLYNTNKWHSVLINKDGIYQYHNNIDNSIEKALEDKFGKENPCELLDIIELAKKESHGTMIVVSDHAEDEAKRLSHCCIKITPKRLDRKVISSITGIDGAILIDPNGICYAIGVILDGIHTTENGESIDRGARHNSARRYTYWAENKVNHKCVCIIVSEDGDISHT